MSFHNRGIVGIMLYIITTVSAFAEPSETIVTEGAEALLTFRHESESSLPYSLCIGQRHPFYKDGQLILDNLTPSQQKRFRVQAWHSRAHQYTLVQVVIKEVQRTDGGSYTCRFFKNETDSPRSKEIALTVNFPPGKAHCWSMQTETEGWVEIQCAAKGGSPPGTVVCRAFQKKEVPVRQTHSQNATHILNNFLVNHDTSIYCCTKNDVNLNDLTCADFVLERERPLHDVKSSVIPLREEVTSLDINLSVADTYAPNTTESNSYQPNFNTTIAIVISISTVIMMTVVVVIVVVYRSRARAKKKDDYSTISQRVAETMPNEACMPIHDSQPVEMADKDGTENNEQTIQDSKENKGKENEEFCSLETKEISERQSSPQSRLPRKPPETEANKEY